MKHEALTTSQIANIVFNVVLCFTAIGLNSITIHAIRKTSSRLLPKPLKALLLSLAVSDIGVGLLNHPLYITRLVIELKQDVTTFATFYWVYLFVSSVFSYASFFGVLSLSLDRFLAIHVHLRYQELMTFKRVVAAVISIWLLSAFLTLIWPQIPMNIAYVVFVIIVGTSFIASGVLNWKIYVTVRRHARQIQSLMVQSVAQVNAPDMANVSRLRKSAFITIYVYIVFLVCYLPNFCMIFVISGGPSIAVKVVKCYTVTLLLLNSSLNPLIYCLKMKHIRQTIMNIVLKAFSSRI